jgi:hypothetical protein
VGRSTDTLRDVASTSGGGVDTGMLSVSWCDQITIWFIASGAAAPTGCTVSLCDANGTQLKSTAITVAVGGSTPVCLGVGPVPAVTNALALGPMVPKVFASGSGGAASTLRLLVLGLPRSTVSAASDAAFLIPNDANTVAHVWWKDGTGFIDTQGNSWTANGTIPQVARTVNAPAGAGPFSDANYYSLGTGTDVLDFAGDLSACVIFSDGVAAAPVIFSDGTYQVDGYFIQTGGVGGTFRHGAGVAAQFSAATANLVLSGLNIGCIGRAGATISAKLNLGTLATSVTGVPSPATTTPARLGRYSGAGNPWVGNLYEAWFSTTTPSDALFTAIMQNVKAKLNITAW